MSKRTTRKAATAVKAVSKKGGDVRSKLILKFNDEKAFGRFCVTLTEEQVPFRLAGNLSIILLSARDVSRVLGEHRPSPRGEGFPMSDRVRGEFNALKGVGVVQIVPSVQPGKRRIPTAQEADQILDELIKSF